MPQFRAEQHEYSSESCNLLWPFPEFVNDSSSPTEYKLKHGNRERQAGLLAATRCVDVRMFDGAIFVHVRVIAECDLLRPPFRSKAFICIMLLASTKCF